MRIWQGARNRGVAASQVQEMRASDVSDQPQSTLSRVTPYVSREELVAQLARLGLHRAAVDEALAVAWEAHGQATRVGGTPYLEEHVYPIAAEVAAYARRMRPGDAETAVIIALLHDTIEDSPAVSRESIATRFGEAIADRVWALTKPWHAGPDGRPPEERERRSLEGIRAADEIVRLVKTFDRLNNLACLHKRDAAKRAEYVAESRAFHLPLARDVDDALAGRMEALLAALEPEL